MFFGALLHEYGHSLAALRHGYTVDGIALWLLRRLAGFETFHENWRHKLIIAVEVPEVERDAYRVGDAMPTDV